MRLSDLGELGLLARLLRYLDRSSGDLLVGAGEDDDAAWREPGGSITVAKVDGFVEGVHFDLAWMPAEMAGWRAAALTLSDLAAKGARPTYGLVALAAPAGTDLTVVEGLYAGLSRCAREFGLRLVGGDTAHTPGPITVAVVALGITDSPPVPRSAARPGWRLAVTGPLGGEAVALAARRPTTPRPRFEAGRALARAGAAAGDISDGLVRELERFQAAAGVGARLWASAIPVAEGATLDQALVSGDEVELVAAGPQAALAGFQVVGELTEEGRIVLVEDGDEREVSGGYDHFA